MPTEAKSVTKEREVILPSVIDQIKDGLDGRTQRWLSLKAQIPENELCKKMKAKKDFTDAEISRINEALKIVIVKP